MSGERNTRIQDIKPQLETLMEQLQEGEVAAEETFAEIEQSLKGGGVDKQLTLIAELIDDIEYESAADIVKTLLTENAVECES